MAREAPTKLEQDVGPQSAVVIREPSVGMAWGTIPETHISIACPSLESMQARCCPANSHKLE